jgi:hypothetical protein
MPSPSTPKRPPKRQGSRTLPSKTKSVDVGIPLGVYDTNSVRDRIRQWQSQGGGVITASDIYVEVGEKDEKNSLHGRLQENGNDKPLTPVRKDIHNEEQL